METQKQINSILGVLSQVDEALGESSDSFTALKSKDSSNPEDRSFSAFVPEQVESAVLLGTVLSQIADAAVEQGQTVGEAVSLALDTASENPDGHSAGVVRHAVKLFLTHNAHGRNFKIPSLMRRVASTDSLLGHSGPPPIGGTTTSEEENRLNWFREDPLMNEHHEHWHVVYPYTGFPSGTPLAKEKRQGEIFLYMHQQMLARYDIERLSEGLDRVKPLSDYREPIDVGYDPGSYATFGHQDADTLSRFPPRPANTSLEDIPEGKPGLPSGYQIATLETLRDRFLDAVNGGYLLAQDGSLLPLSGNEGSNLLGIENEPSAGRENFRYYGWHHGAGHILISSVGNPGAQDGIMASEEANLRDPVFWRWHKHIDGFNQLHQENLAPYDFSDAPTIKLSEDGELGEGSIATVVGGAKINSVRTETRRGVVSLSNGLTYSYNYLWHEEFGFSIRASNQTSEDVALTLRIFLCPMKIQDELSTDDEWLNDRTLWVEMDKISVIASRSEVSEYFRQDKDSSVIKKPAVLSPADVEDTDIPDGGATPPDDHYCDCGWPYHLLLPKGKADGMKFGLLVVATDGKRDLVPSASKCGSLSFCGTKDRYPDERAMGYPFDRPMEVPLVDLVKRQSNFALTTITISHTDKLG